MKSEKYIISHALVHRCYEMLKYLGAFKGRNMEKKEIKKQIYNNLHEIETVETYAKYFNMKKNKNKKRIELKCNLSDLINDLNYLKQYLELETTSNSCFLMSKSKEEN